jgi:hypothetical protein
LTEIYLYVLRCRCGYLLMTRSRYVNEQKPQDALATMRRYIAAHPDLAELHEEAADKAAEPEPEPAPGVAAREESPVPATDFTASAEWAGVREGWMFSTAANGTGCHIIFA